MNRIKKKEGKNSGARWYLRVYRGDKTKFRAEKNRGGIVLYES